ncbi:glycosyltransferase family 4 protein [Cupriavidus basilensis]|uniref:glycosyltransferase family 4 protein n=1 Tax=Cupriavidus basilensis TaxID=68895 RepID=UPI0023E88EA6|nr:glycosyltransferase family 4 protein [Cupriavidus basilensis]MDF3886719.1 glycosyltransferase family 4 protein [Cupriavidus basilensis]
MRVLHFYKTFLPETTGGVEQFIRQLCRSGSDHGIENTVLSLTRKHSATSTETEGFLVHSAKRDMEIASTGFSFSALSRFRELTRQADIVHYHFPWPFMDMAHFATRVRKPSVVTYHSDIVRQQLLLRLYRPLKRRFLDSVDRIVATSPQYAASSPVLKDYAHKVDVIPIGLDRAAYPPTDSERIEHWRQRVGNKFFLFVGVFRYYKGLHLLLDAAKRCGHPVVLVGEGPEEERLRKQARVLSLDNVIFAGQLPDADKSALLTLCHAVVMPSSHRSEAFCISLLEGAMFGRPMISTAIGTGTSHVNQHGVTGIVVPPNDAAALADAMQTLWHDTAMAARMGEDAMSRWERLFLAGRVAQRYHTLYAELLDTHAVGQPFTRGTRSVP